jgi:hypothetical protein
MYILKSQDQYTERRCLQISVKRLKDQVPQYASNHSGNTEKNNNCDDKGHPQGLKKLCYPTYQIKFHSPPKAFWGWGRVWKEENYHHPCSLLLTFQQWGRKDSLHTII